MPMLRGSLLKGMYRSSLRLEGVMWDMLKMFWRSAIKSTNEKSMFVCSLLMQDSNRGGMIGIYFCLHFRPNHQESNQTIDSWDGRNKICSFSVPGIQSLLLQLHLSTNLRD